MENGSLRAEDFEVEIALEVESYVLQVSFSAIFYSIYIRNSGSKCIDLPETIVFDQMVLTRWLQSTAFELYDTNLLTLERILLSVIEFLRYSVCAACRLMQRDVDLVILCCQHADVEYVIVLDVELSKEGFVNKAALAALVDVVINRVARKFQKRICASWSYRQQLAPVSHVDIRFVELGIAQDADVALVTEEVAGDRNMTRVPAIFVHVHIDLRCMWAVEIVLREVPVKVVVVLLDEGLHEVKVVVVEAASWYLDNICASIDIYCGSPLHIAVGIVVVDHADYLEAVEQWPSIILGKCAVLNSGLSVADKVDGSFHLRILEVQVMKLQLVDCILTCIFKPFVALIKASWFSHRRYLVLADVLVVMCNEIESMVSHRKDIEERQFMLNLEDRVRTSIVQEQWVYNAYCRGLDVLEVDGRGSLSCVVLSEFAICDADVPWASLLSMLFADSIFESGFERFVFLLFFQLVASIVLICRWPWNCLIADGAHPLLRFVICSLCFLWRWLRLVGYLRRARCVPIGGTFSFDFDPRPLLDLGSLIGFLAKLLWVICFLYCLVLKGCFTIKHWFEHFQDHSSMLLFYLLLFNRRQSTHVKLNWVSFWNRVEFFNLLCKGLLWSLPGPHYVLVVSRQHDLHTCANII